MKTLCTLANAASPFVFESPEILQVGWVLFLVVQFLVWAERRFAC